MMCFEIKQNCSGELLFLLEKDFCLQLRLNIFVSAEKMKDVSSASLFRGRFDHAAQRACFFEVICLSYMLPVRSSSLTHFAPYGEFESQESSLIALRVKPPTQSTPLGGRLFLKNWALS